MGRHTNVVATGERAEKRNDFKVNRAFSASTVLHFLMVSVSDCATLDTYYGDVNSQAYLSRTLS